LFFARRQVARFAREVPDHASEFQGLRLKWLNTLLVLAYVALSVDILDIATGPTIQLWYLAPAVALLSLTVLAYLSLRVSPLFAREVQSQQSDALQEVPMPKEEERAGLTDEELLRQKDRLTGVVEKQTLYLNPELRLSDLAAAVGMRPYRVSEVLNRGLHTSFYDLINRYRVARAQELLGSPRATHLNLLGVAMESGFKSKSVFNEVFKKRTGLTPSQFRSTRMTGSSDSDNRIASSGR
jgi:AraC-like DNA-binding protein